MAKTENMLALQRIEGLLLQANEILSKCQELLERLALQESDDDADPVG